MVHRTSLITSILVFSHVMIATIFAEFEYMEMTWFEIFVVSMSYLILNEVRIIRKGGIYNASL